MEISELIDQLSVKSNFRYERKFTLDGYNRREVERLILFHPAYFKEIFHLRQVNNIYLDTDRLDYYVDNKLGIAERKKFRIRWYGETFGEVNPVLEIKIKKGLVGDKWQFKLKSFQVDENINQEQLLKVFEASDLPKAILEYLQPLSPSLLNHYKRTYFLSLDKKFRITIDSDLKYLDMQRRNNFFRKKFEDEGHIIVELKYAIKDDVSANQVSNNFPFRIDKSSKYVNGIDHIFGAPLR